MTLIGKHLGPYEIISQLGAGGMGEVYRAHDTRLGRAVAIKVLPAAFADNPDRLKRFEQEARATSAINHPNILTIYDFGTTGPEDACSPFIVAELLEGRELRQEMKNGPIGSRRVLEYARQMAGGLAAAHDKGIIHRDLKPENLFITNDNLLKILDFGLAKLKPITIPTECATEKPTEIGITNPGVVMGTAGYMSPEQVRGQVVDHRSDIFSFGVILHEMLSGERTFKGASPLDVINAILTTEPEELVETHPKINPALAKIVGRCLEKNPAQRFQSTTDLCFAIEALSTSSSPQLETTGVDMRSSSKRTHRHWAVILAVIALAGLLGSLLLLSFVLQRKVEERLVRSYVPEPENFGINSGVFSISPDGRYIAFGGVLPGKQLLWVRPLDGPSWRSLPATEGASFPFWSPDSRYVAFYADRKLKKIDLAGGPPLTVCDAPEGLGGTWNRDGTIVFNPDAEGPLHQVFATGGQSTPLTRLSQGSTWDRWPEFLPDGKHFLFSRETGVYLASLDTEESKPLVQAASNAIYANGFLLFLRAQTLMAQQFDVERLQLTGDAFAIAEGIPTWGLRGAFSSSDQGLLVFRTGRARGTLAQLTWVDRDGKQLGLVGDPGLYPNLQLSPDGKKLALTTGGWARSLGIYDLQRNVSTRLSLDPAAVSEAAWSTDGHRIVFNSNRSGKLDLYQKSADGAGSDELLVTSNLEKYPTSWSPDGQLILFDVLSLSSSKSDIWVFSLADRKAFPFLQTQFNESRGQFSPDGHWVLYTSDESGRDEVYVASFPGLEGKLRLSQEGGTYPRWRHDGKEIFYVSPDNKLRSVVVELKDGTVKIGETRVLFEFRPANLHRNGYPYDVTADGRKFLVNIATESKEQMFITLVQNWTLDVKAFSANYLR